jgi:hypothetical protein
MNHVNRVPLLALVAGLVAAGAGPGSAAPVCYGVVLGKTPIYPVDASSEAPNQGHFQQCIVQNPTGETLQRIKNLAGYLQMLNYTTSPTPTPGKTGAGRDMQNAGAHFYYFHSRADYAAFVTARWPRPPLVFTENPYLPTAGADRCGITISKGGYTDTETQAPVGLISAVFDFCTYAQTGKTRLNRSPVEAMQHESGHNFNEAVGLRYGVGDKGPAQSAAFRSIVEDDLNTLDKTWNSTPAVQKDAKFCSIFGNQVVASTLERDLNTPSTPMCDTKGHVALAQYKNQPPSVALKGYFPYFFAAAPGASNLYEEIWASLMIAATGGANNPEILPATNHAFAALACANAVYLDYYRNGVAPPQNSNVYNACSSSFVRPDPASFH